LSQSINGLGTRAVEWVQQTLENHRKLLNEITEQRYYLAEGALVGLKEEVDRFISPDWLREIPFEQWRHCSRILSCYSRRIGKIKEDVDCEQEKKEMVQRYVDNLKPLWEKREQLVTLQLWSLKQFRWMIEEFKVSLFAQNLKTAFPISQKRLDKFWHDIILPLFP
ncbi:MAG: DUF3418 domain-containing protein, partial [Proteobacteria bacterium]|nr:DUF3418 domain-containing protein [Pseudomonadota bacterium]